MHFPVAVRTLPLAFLSLAVPASAGPTARPVAEPASRVLVRAQTPLPAAAPPRALLLDVDHSEWSVRAPDLFRARFVTSEGDFVLEAHRRWAPVGVDRLYNLVRLGYYDNLRVHRVRAGFIAQFGVSGDPEINAAWVEHAMPDEPRRRSNLRGTVSYASLEAADSRTTQLFINLADNTRLDPQGFAPVARVVEGMDTVERFYTGYDESAGGGMRGGRQGRLVVEGNDWLDAEFPLLARIHSARIEPARVMRFPDVGANRIRAEAHLLPAVSTGPMDPTYSPDGSSIAFSMRGDIWVIPAEGGEARALTAGPAYHFEPDWSPDGRRLAFSRELDGDHDIGVVGVDGSGYALVTTDPHVDISPVWGVGGAGIYFASARSGSFDIWFREVASAPSSAGRALPVVMAPGHQIQPALSPDGRQLALVSPVRGRIGSGGLWTLPLGDALDGSVAADEAAGTRRIDASRALEGAALIHFEETSYRAEPAWSADGRALLFVSDAAGSNDVAIVPAAGGSAVRLTQEASGEYEPAASPDGRRIAFVSNRTGATRLMTAPAGGARRAGWSEVRIAPLRPREPHGRLTVRVVDAASGQPVAARLQVVASDERAYAPAAGFHRTISATDEHYFHASGEARLWLPAGIAEVEAFHGPEFARAAARVRVEPDGEARLVIALERLVDGPARGWLSGDTHAHDLHQGRFGLDHARFFEQLVAEDMRVTNALIHMDGTRLMGRWDDLTGEPHPLSTASHLLQYAQEFRGSFGHVGLLGVGEFVMPLIGGAGDTAFAADVLNFPYLDAARARGGIGGFMHPYTRRVREPGDGAGSEIALDAALGKGEFFDVACIWYDEIANAEMYGRLLGAGIRLAATGGSDNFADVWRDPPPGTSRTYARLDGAPSVPAWLEAVRRRQTFATNGPLLFLTVETPDGGVLRPGEETEAGAIDAVRATLEVVSNVPLERVELLVNGRAVEGFDVRGRGHRFVIDSELEVRGAAWIAARAVGPPARGLADSYAYAHTSPIDLLYEDERHVDPRDAAFLAAMVRGWWERVDARDRFADAAARRRFHQAAQQALAFYERAAAAGESKRRE